MILTRTCEYEPCGRDFTSRREHARFCSASHRVAWNRAHRGDRGEAEPTPTTAVTRNTVQTLDRIALAMSGVEPPRVDELIEADPTPPPDDADTHNVAALLDTLWSLVTRHVGIAGIADLVPAVRDALNAADWVPSPVIEEDPYAGLREWNGPVQRILNGALTEIRGRSRVQHRDVVDLLRRVSTDTYGVAADQFRHELRLKEAEEEWAAAHHDPAVPEVTPARGTRALIEQLIALTGELVAWRVQRGVTTHLHRRGADSFARRVRAADRDEVREQLQRLRGLCHEVQEWISEAEAELPAY